MKYSLEKWGRAPITRAPIILGARALIILGGLELPFLRGREHSLFQGGTPVLNNVALLEYSFVHKQ